MKSEQYLTAIEKQEREKVFEGECFRNLQVKTTERI